MEFNLKKLCSGLKVNKDGVIETPSDFIQTLNDAELECVAGAAVRNNSCTNEGDCKQTINSGSCTNVSVCYTDGKTSKG